MAPSSQQTHRLVHTCGSHDPAAGFLREKAIPAARACPYPTPCCRPAARRGQGSGPKATAQPGDRKAAVVQGPRAEQLQQKAGRERWEVAAVARRDRWGTVHVPREQAGGQRGARLRQLELGPDGWGPLNGRGWGEHGVCPAKVRGQTQRVWAKGRPADVNDCRVALRHESRGSAARLGCPSGHQLDRAPPRQAAQLPAWSPGLRQLCRGF